MHYIEETQVQQTTAEYLQQKLGWDLMYAYNNEDFGPDSLLGHACERDIVPTRPLRRKITKGERTSTATASSLCQ